MERVDKDDVVLQIQEGGRRTRGHGKENKEEYVFGRHQEIPLPLSNYRYLEQSARKDGCGKECAYF